jgi:putative cofactor-binding repeat protein
MCPSSELKRWSSVSWSASVLLVVVWLSLCSGIVRSEFSFELTHRFSEKARRELRERHGDKFVDWPAQGTTEFVQLMCYRDIVRHKGRLLAAGSNLLAAVDGNTTYFNSNDG